MKNKHNITAILATLATLVAVGAGSAHAQSVWKDYDAESPLLVRYIGSDTATITVTTGKVEIVDNLWTNTHTFATQVGTLATLKANIDGATNASGTKQFQTIYWAGTSGDSATATYFVAASSTTITREWSKVLKWDTSTCLHYDACINPGATDKPVGGYLIDRIFGSPDGTGNVTLSVYADGTKRYQRTFTSPTYDVGATGLVIPYAYGGTNEAAAIGYYTNTLYTADNTVTLDVDLGSGIFVGSGEPGFVRATRATTATTGGLGVSFKPVGR